MPFTVDLTANARRDIQAAIDWENRRSPGLGRRLFEVVDKMMIHLATNPLSGTIRYDTVRCRKTDVFPYLIHYVVDEQANTVTVLRVLHTSRKPER
jgi:plasmid stabilization system protein ParE